MAQPEYYEIRVEGCISSAWSDWFAGLTVNPGPGNETLIAGRLADQAELHGILMRIRDLRLVLISVNRIAVPTCLD